jgi:hypothetical protein
VETNACKCLNCSKIFEQSVNETQPRNKEGVYLGICKQCRVEKFGCFEQKRRRKFFEYGGRTGTFHGVKK